MISSTADPSLAPPGKHVMSLNMLHAPRDLAEGSWDTERDIFGNRIIDILDEYMPGLKDKIIDARFWSPLDLEQEFGLLGGNIAHLDMTPRYMFGLRPMHELADYRSPIHGPLLLRIQRLAGRHRNRDPRAQREPGHPGRPRTRPRQAGCLTDRGEPGILRVTVSLLAGERPAMDGGAGG